MLSLDIVGDRIEAIYNVLNPDKLHHVPALPVPPLWTSTDPE